MGTIQRYPPEVLPEMAETAGFAYGCQKKRGFPGLPLAAGGVDSGNSKGKCCEVGMKGEIRLHRHSLGSVGDSEESSNERDLTRDIALL